MSAFKGVIYNGRVTGKARLSTAVAVGAMTVMLWSAPALAQKKSINDVTTVVDDQIFVSGTSDFLNQPFLPASTLGKGKVSPLNTGASTTAPKAVSLLPTATPQPAGQYLNADGTTTTNLEAAAQTWRVDPEFARNPSYAMYGTEYAYARGITGAGVKIGVMDSGVIDYQGEYGSRLHHVNTRALLDLPDDADRWPYEFGAFDGKPLVGFSGEHWHGTHVGSTIGAARNGKGAHGIAYGSDIYAATGYLAGDFYVYGRGVQMDAQSPGIRALVDNGARIINNSWGGNFLDNEDELPTNFDRGTLVDWLTEYYNTEDTALRDAMRHADEKGTVLIFANGNSSRGVDDEKGPLRVHAGVQASAPLALPELEDHFLSVASVDYDSNISYFSQECGHARFWCVSAVGEGIDAAAAVREFSRDGINAAVAKLGYVPSLDEARADAVTQDLINAWLETGDGAELAYHLIMSTAANLSLLTDEELAGLIPPGRNGVKQMASIRDIIDLITSSNFRLPLEFAAVIHDRELIFGSFQTGLQRAYNEFATPVPDNYLSSGTSMATPQVSAGLGLIMERFSYLDSAQTRQILLTTSKDIGDTGVDTVYGWGLMDLGKAMNGPGAFLADWNVTVGQGISDTWSNDIVNGIVYTGREQDHGALIFNGAGSLTLSGNNAFDGLTVNGGTLALTANNVFTKDAVVNGGLFNLSGMLTAPAVQVNGGQFNLSGTLDATPLRVNGGMAIVDATGRLSHSNLYVGAVGGIGTPTVIFNGIQNGGTTTVAANGLLGGNGTMGSTTIYGTISPGQSIGTLTIDGDYTQAAGSNYIVELTPPDKSDRIVVTGKAMLQGGTVVASRNAGVYNLGQVYTILSAGGGVTGQFAGLDTSAITPFLKLGLHYSPSTVTLDVKRGAALVTAAKTPNQLAVAGAADGLADSNVLLQKLVQLFPNQAEGAFDALSGEIHASVQTGLLNDSRYVRDTAFIHATGPGIAPGKTAIWITGMGGSGELEGDGNFAQLDTRTRGYLIGADHQFDAGLQIGGFAGWGDNRYQVGARASTAETKAIHFGVYAGKQWGGLGVRGGLTFSDYRVDTDRHIVFPGLDEKLVGDYDARTRQLFAEVGYRFGSARISVEPYVRYANVRTSSDGFTETGGIAALDVAKRKNSTDLASFGARINAGLTSPSSDKLNLRFNGSVARQYAFGDRSSTAIVAFADSVPFDVIGALYPKTSTNVDAMITADISQKARLQVGYTGQFSKRGDDNGIRATLSYAF